MGASSVSTHEAVFGEHLQPSPRNAVPFVDLQPQNDQVRAEVRRRWDHAIDGGTFVLGTEVERFEEEVAEAWGVEHCVGLGNGTDAVEVALRAAGVGPGDEVVVPAFTFAGSAVGIVRCGARPVFVDVEEDTLLIDPAQVEAAIGPATAAVVAVHLYGQMADMQALGRICATRGVALVEDGAQSHGARGHGEPTASRSLVTATSFYPTKNLGAWGDGGAVLTNDASVASAARAIRNYGSAGKYDHTRFGFNSRLDVLQAAVLRAKLPYLRDWNAQRVQAAHRYDRLLSECPTLHLPVARAYNEHVWHLYTVQVPEREGCRRALGSQGIGSGVHYPTPLHRLPMFQGRDQDERPDLLPVAEAAAERVLSLPIYPGITTAQQERVAEVLVSWATTWQPRTGR
ncbi:MAG: DegT/DnrJ/EryC1/StrS family aminotransferase [Actinomycetota bacterium]|nr:DegT/DnrJ/EryC1/StrS family aminotransferase [Actinomycetota bacterium]